MRIFCVILLRIFDARVVVAKLFLIMMPFVESVVELVVVGVLKRVVDFVMLIV